MSPRRADRDFTRDNNVLMPVKLLQQMQFRSVAAGIGAVWSIRPGAGGALLCADQDAVWPAAGVPVRAQLRRSLLCVAPFRPDQAAHYSIIRGAPRVFVGAFVLFSSVFGWSSAVFGVSAVS